jgi:hypothetical protein
LGLEIPFDEQTSIDRFLDSSGGAAAEARLTEGAFWRPERQDGRSSIAMLNLIEQVRALRASGYKVRIIAYDSKSGTPAQERDRVMARNLAAVAGREPRNFLVALSGNVHNRLTRGVSWDKEYEPLGYLLTKSGGGSRVTSLNMGLPFTVDGFRRGFLRALFLSTSARSRSLVVEIDRRAGRSVQRRLWGRSNYCVSAGEKVKSLRGRANPS